MLTTYSAIANQHLLSTKLIHSSVWSEKLAIAYFAILLWIKVVLAPYS
ncbi:hypothetical protein H6G35_35045 [Aulosira sp. FACHB-113]|nr:hypothetical protein [Aulosira sp. FACHB-113]